MKESVAGNAISTCKFLPAFERIADDWATHYQTCIQLARITGNRWAYVAGKTQGPCLDFTPRQIRLNTEWGLVIYSDDSFPLKDDQVIDVFKKYLGTL